MTLSSGISNISDYEQARRAATLQGTANPSTPMVKPAPIVASSDAASGAAAQAAEGAQQAQPKAETFNAPMLDLPPDPSSQDVLTGLARAMADPSVNASSAQQLFSLYDQIMQAEKAMTQAIIDGMLM